MDAYEEHTEYLEKLILAQLEASRVFTHGPTVGDVREHFLRNIIEQRKQHFRAIKGQIALPKEKTLEQCDIAVQLKSTNCLDLGGQFIINPHTTLAIIEIKTRLGYDDCRKLNALARRIKKNCIEAGKTPPLFGLFAYNFKIAKNNLAQRFGYSFDKGTQTIYRDSALKLIYPHIDFLVCLDTYIDDATGDKIDNKIFLQRTSEVDAKGKTVQYFFLEQAYCFRKFLELVDSLG